MHTSSEETKTTGHPEKWSTKECMCGFFGVSCYSVAMLATVLTSVLMINLVSAKHVLIAPSKVNLAIVV